MLAGMLALTTGCDAADIARLGMRAPVTRQGLLTLHLWEGSWLAALCVGVVVWGLILWVVIFHRKRSDRIPAQVRYNLPIEVMYTVLPFVMIGVLFYYTARDENSIDALSAHPDVVVNVTGYQWRWEFQYPQYPVKGSSYGVTELGQMWNGNLGAGDNESQLPLLEIPDNESVRFNLVSIDVDHAFWVIPFNFKRDVLPGHPNHFQVTPITTSTSIGRCSELCGLYHSRMLFRVKIVTPAQFHTWILAQQAAQNVSGGAQ